MNVFVVNASPFGRRGLTAQLLSPFLDGMREAGGEINLVHLTKLKINPCRGDLSCWFKTKNRCIQNDAMKQITHQFTDADIVVFATPVYCDGVPGHLKTMMDRLVAGSNPRLVVKNGHSRHPVPDDKKNVKFVLIASCGLWELDNFFPMEQHLKAFCRNLGVKYSGSLLRPHSFAMKNRQVNDIFRATKKAGKQIMKRETIDASLLRTVSREILSCDEYIEMINKQAGLYLGESGVAQ